LNNYICSDPIFIFFPAELY